MDRIQLWKLWRKMIRLPARKTKRRNPFREDFREMDNDENLETELSAWEQASDEDFKED